MDGFDPALNGFYDVADLPTRYLQERTRRACAALRDRKRSIDAVAAFEERRKRIREAFLDGIGGLPEGSDGLAVERAGVLEREDHRVERVVFESLPGFRVTANCYVPDGEGPHPAVLFCCGHVEAAKGDELNQKACLELVANGVLVFAFDPIGQGERVQYPDPETGDPLIEGGGGAFVHSYAGQQCYYAGANLARYFVRDARRALDYLHDRPDVDADRVGVTGTSGGGMQTAYLALVDDRVDAAAPCCFVCDREAFAKTGNSGDAEQNVVGAVPAGIDYDDLVTGMAPRPVCVGAARSDEYFPIEGVHDAVDRIREVYDLYDAAGNVELVVADRPHASVFEIGSGVFGFLCDALGVGSYESRDEHPVVDADRLHCTDPGNVHAAFDDERSIRDLLVEYVDREFPDAGSRPVPEGDAGESIDPEAYADRIRTRVVDRLGLDRDGCPIRRRVVANDEVEGLDVQYVFFPTERDPEALVAGVLVADPDASFGSSEGDADGERPTPAVVCYEEGTRELPDRGEDLVELASQRGAAFAVDPRGVGAVRNRHVPMPPWNEDYYGIYGTEYKLAYDALLLGESLFGMRVYDVCRAVEFLRAETGCESVSLVGSGVGAYHALYAAVAESEVGTVELRDLGPSFHEMATSREYPYDPRLTVADVLDCDVPHALAALDARGVRVDRSGQ